MSGNEFRGRLRAHGVLPTAQRVEVAELILGRPQHLSADQILDRLRENGSTVSKATVYNCLKIFSESGLVKEINVDATRRFYASTHHHFYHVGTGQLTDIDADEISISNLPPLPEGTEKEGVEVLIRVRDKRFQSAD